MDSCFTCRWRAICAIKEKQGTITGCKNWEPIDDFNPEEIEQMEVEFEECSICQGCGYMWNGIITYRCTVCHGTGEVEVRKEESHEPV